MSATQRLSVLSLCVIRKSGRTPCLVISLLLTALCALSETSPAKAAPKVEGPKEILFFKNGDQLTGKLLDSTGTDIKFDSDMAGEITVPLEKIKELRSSREFAVVPKDIKDSRISENVPQGHIKIENDSVVVIPHSEEKATPTPTTGETAKGVEGVPAKPEEKQSEKTTETSATTDQDKTKISATPANDTSQKTIEAARIGFIVDDPTYQQEIHKKIGFRSGWDGHIATGSTTILATQDSYLFLIHVDLKRSVPTVSWLDPKLRTLLDYTQSAGRTSQPGTVTTNTNILHGSAERDEYFSRRGYYLQQLSYDHDTTQGLNLQQIYGFGVGATLVKTAKSEFDVTADLHYESQAFNSTADVSTLNRHLIGSSLTETYTHKFGKLNFDEKFLADIAWNNASAFSAAANSAVRMPIYKKLAFSVSVIDNFQNDPQVGYNKNSFQFSTGFALALH